MDLVFFANKSCCTFRPYRVFKRLIDLLLSFFLLLVFSPLMLFIAIMVKFDSKGPVIYTQKRLGYKGRGFVIYKFRSMKANAEKDGMPQWAQKKDPRVTKTGAFLRVTHLDELPQLFNVIKGEMSLIGPRPERPEIAYKLRESLPNYFNRLQVRPGITGLAQVRHRYDEDIRDVAIKLKYDLFYIKHLSMAMDAMVILETIEHMLLGKGV